jgi:septal ring factor EnvC (AmiA/AmiB activator)
MMENITYKDIAKYVAVAGAVYGVVTQIVLPLAQVQTDLAYVRQTLAEQSQSQDDIRKEQNELQTNDAKQDAKLLELQKLIERLEQ